MPEDYPRRYADYVLLDRLGQGGMSEVDLARKVVDQDPAFVRFLVIKRIKTDRSADGAFIRMFKDEARITAELHHENIGQVYDFGREGDEYYMALEYVPGIDVRYLINVLRERKQRVPVRVALKVMHDVLKGLYHAHTKRDTFGKPMRIVHRDVNPRNIMLSIRGEVKLIDFGVAKATDRLERTRTDHVKGKFSYMAPEQISGLQIDHRADLYAVGLTLHEFLSGASPFAGLNQVQIMHRMVSGQAPPMPEVPEVADAREITAVHQKALARDPKDRYQTAEEFRKAIAEVAESIGGLPSQEQLASFLNSVDPGLTRVIQERMEAFAAIEITADGVINHPATSMGDISAVDELLPTPIDGAAPYVSCPNLAYTTSAVWTGTLVTATGAEGVISMQILGSQVDDVWVGEFVGDTLTGRFQGMAQAGGANVGYDGQFVVER